MCSTNLPAARKIPVSFREGPIHGVLFISPRFHEDQRGWLVEIYRQDELPADIQPVMSYISQTLPDAVRGPHEHVLQTDYFVFLGPGDFTLYLWDIRAASPTWGNRAKFVVGHSNKQIVIVPPGVVHAYKNCSTVPGWVINLPNRLFAGTLHQEAVDEIRHEAQSDNPFLLD